MPPRFITLDGIDGAGKTTQLEVVRQWFEGRGLPVRFTREPGGTALGEELRRILLDPATRASLHSETLLMFAARSQHLAEVVCPALEQAPASFATALPTLPLLIRAAAAVWTSAKSPNSSAGCRAA